MHSIQIYFTYVGMYFKSRAEYKLSFIIGNLANIFHYISYFVVYWILISSLTSINGWNFNELSILYGLNLLPHAISGLVFWNAFFYFIQGQVKSGGFDRFLLRPMGIVTQLCSSTFGYTFIAQIILSCSFLIPAFLKTGDKITKFKILYIVISIFGSVMLFAGMVIFIGSLSFWMMNSTQIGQMVYYEIRDLTNYPLSIYPNFLRILLTVVFPWAFVSYYPCLFILDKISGKWDFILAMISPLVGILVFLLSLVFFYCSMRRYESCGN
ncbi:MAG: ABC transporter permease [Ruminiclostridium sp.]